MFYTNPLSVNSQNGQNDELFECVLPFYGVGA